jgi:hypothetical protein
LRLGRAFAFRFGESNMRQIVIIATTAMITAIAASWATVIIAQARKNPDAAVVSAAELMQLMKGAKSLADEKADPVD